MRIGIDVRLINYRRGMGNYVANLVNHLLAQSGDEEYVLYTDKRGVPAQIRTNRRVCVRTLVPRNEVLWEQVSLAYCAWRDGLDIIHCPSNTAPLFLPRSIRLVVTLHDVMFLLSSRELPESPSLRQRLGRRYRSLIVPNIVRRASHIITVSNFSKQDVIKHLSVSAARIRVIPEAPGLPILSKPGLGLDLSLSTIKHTAPYILAFGADDPRKNTTKVINAYAELRKRHEVEHRLVLCSLTESARERFLHVVAAHGLQRWVDLLGFVSEEELVHLYKNATMLVYPSIYEGFGLPVLEAMACGTAVICSATTSIPEVAGDAAILLDPNDSSAISSAMWKLAHDGELRQDLVTRGLRRAKEFSWERAARETLEVYREAQ